MHQLEKGDFGKQEPSGSGFCPSPVLGSIASNATLSAEALQQIGLGPTQSMAVRSLLARRAPILMVHDSSALHACEAIFQAVVLAPGVHAPLHSLKQVLALDGILLLIGSGDPRLDALKLGFQEHGHIGVEAPFYNEVWWGGPSSPKSSTTEEGELPIIVSYFTADTPYEEEARKLMASCDAVGIAHHISRVPNRGSWEANCAYKADFLAGLWRELRRPLLWVDADGVLKRSPILLRGTSCDFAIHKVDRWEFNSATVFFNSTPLAGQLLQHWAALCRSYPHIWDQRLLDAAWEELMRNHPLITFWLPSSYTLIFDRPEAIAPKEPPVIVQYQSSRRFKAAVSSVVYQSPVPPMCSAWRRARKAARGWLDSSGCPRAARCISKPDYLPFPGTPAQIPQAFARFSRRLNRWLRKNGRRTHRIAIFGASWFGARIAAQLRMEGIEPVSFIDNLAEKAGKTLVGIPVQHPESMKAALDLIIVASIEHSRVIAKQLGDANLEPHPLILAAHQSRLGCS
jgi:hypothetical protein